MRILERFNRTAELKAWPVRLGWYGLEPVGEHVSAGADGGEASATSPAVITDPPEAEAAFRGLIRRFARPERVAEVVAPDATTPCQEAGFTRS